jgi:hypothetical protein
VTVTDDRAIALSKRLLEPYEFPEGSPYLSDDQRELSRMTLKERAAWMAEWLALADRVAEPEPDSL